MRLGTIAAGAALLLAIPMALVALVLVLVMSDSSEDQGLPGVVCAPEGASKDKVAGYGGVQLANAAAIVAAGKEMQLPQRAWVIAVAVAMQESTLEVKKHGDAAGPDSRGLFQQRDSWGPLHVRMDPKGSAKLFYERLTALPNWQTLPLTVAAQRVQISALPTAYAKHEQAASEVVGAVEGIACAARGGDSRGKPGRAQSQAEEIVERARSQIGVPYVWGGGNANGPTATRASRGLVGFDCSGLAIYAYANVGVELPHHTASIYRRFPPVVTDVRQARSAVQPGDLILLSSAGPGGVVDHVGVYAGDDRVIHAPQEGESVKEVANVWTPGSWWSTHFVGAVRPGAQVPKQS